LFLNLEHGGQTRVLRELKKALRLGWKEMAELLEVNRSMVFFYLKETCRMPYEKILLVEKKNPELNLSGYTKLETIELADYGKNMASRPVLDNKLAEFLGALAGDGCVCKTGNEVSISCSAIVDRDYIENRINRLFWKLFKIKPKIRTQKNLIQCRTYSKEIRLFLSKNYGFPVGNRKNRTFIPRKILDNPALLSCYLRGLFDTDGSFHRKRIDSAVVEYISHSPKFLLQIRDSLRKLGFSASLSGTSVYIYDQKQVHEFFKKVKPKNLKHITKYKIFKETGKVPVHKEIAELLRP